MAAEIFGVSQFPGKYGKIGFGREEPRGALTRALIQGGNNSG
jgi:hypothetical protein